MRAVHRTVLLIALLAGCVAPTNTQQSQGVGPQPVTSVPAYVPDLPIALPDEDVQVSWKQILDQPYVFFEHQGSYTESGALIPVIHREMASQGLAASGPPFCLFYDDPGKVAVDQLRSRTCVPVSGPRSPLTPLRYDVLPSTTVVYAVVAGPYPDVPRSYPALYRFLGEQGWAENGPIREIYLVPPTAVENYQQLATEVQVPAGPLR